MKTLAVFQKCVNLLLVLTCLILPQRVLSANDYTEMNIYATVLSVQKKMSNNSRQVTVKFLLSAPAKGVWVYIDTDKDGDFEDETAVYSNSDLVLPRDVYSSVTFELNDQFAGGQYDWAVKVQGAPKGTDYNGRTNINGGKSFGFNTSGKQAELVRDYTNPDHRYKFAKPKGLAVNTNFNSKYCGYIYVGEAGALSGLKKNSKRPIRLGSSQGLYAFKPNSGTIWSNKEDALLNKAPFGAFVGDVSWYNDEEQYNGPSHVYTDEDDYVYISQNHPTSINGKEFEERIWRVKASDLKDNNKNAEFECILTTTMLNEQKVGNDKLYRRVLAMSVGKIGNSKLLYVISGYSENKLLTSAALSSWEIKEENDGTCSLTFIKSMNLKSIPYGSSTKQDLMSQYCSVVPGNDNGDLWIFQRVTEGEKNTFAAIHLSPTNTAWTLDYRIGSENYYNITGTGALSKHHTLGNTNDYYLVFPGYTKDKPTPSIKVFRMFINANGNLTRDFQFNITNPEDTDGALGGFAPADGIAIDAANNIFFGSSITEKVYMLSLPKENEHITPSNASAKLNVPYKVTWVDANNGTLVSGKKHAYMFATDAMPVLKKDDLIFQGWYTDANFSGSPVSSVTSNCTLYAKWIDAYKGVGVFSVSNTEVVTFAPGNLQYTQSTKSWAFAANQYEMLGTNNVTGGTAGTQSNGEYREGTALADKIDLFGWGTGNAPTKATKDDDYATFVEWGTNIIGNDPANTWQTLSRDEWNYILNKRTNASSLYGIAKVNNVNGMIILPDNWVCPAGITFKSGLQEELGMDYYSTHQTFTAEQWKKMEDAGAVFLPAAAYRNEYTVTAAQYQGYYWTSTKNTEKGGLYYYYFTSKASGISSHGDTFTARSVRLAKEVSPILVDPATTKVTSTTGQTITQYVRITIADKVGTTTITGKSNNPAFTVTPLQNVGPGEHDLIVTYKPTATTDGIETDTITLTCSNISAKTLFQMSGRHLPANFVIAAKADNDWVALTANIAGSAAQKAIPILVDNPTTPTKVTFASHTCQYQLLGLTDTRFTANGTAAHLYSTQTQKVLNASADADNKTYLNTDATHANAQTSANALFYEWKLVSEDLVHYTLTNSNQAADWDENRILGYSAESGMWAMYPTDDHINQELFLLPVETALTENTEVMEWATNSMVLRCGDANPNSLNITLAGTTTAYTLTPLNGSDLYQINNIDLTNNDCEIMVICDNSNNGTIIRKPIIINEDAESSNYSAEYCSHCHLCDIVVLNGAELSAGDDYVDFANLYLYPGAQLVLDEQSLGIKQQVYLRGGYSWLNPTIYALPEVYLNGDINFIGSANIIYDYYIQNYKYYQFALPYTVPLANVTDEAGYDTFPVWVKHYNGALRAANAHATSWEWYYGNNFERGIGYIIAAQPRQIGTTANRPLSIIRFPLGNNELNTTNGFETACEVSTTAHGIEGYKAGTVTANNVGWNFVGNPFLSTWKGDIGHNQLQKHPNEANWDGSYTWVNNKVKYITIMSAESGSDYDQYVASNTELKPFFPFYLQEAADGGTGSIDFATANRQRKAPAAMYAQEALESYIQIEIATTELADQAGLFVSDKYSDGIDFDDYEKLFGSSADKAKLWLLHDDQRMAFEAISPARAATYIPLGYRAPSEGEYTLSINPDVSQLVEVEAVYLIDNETGVEHDLLSQPYTFQSQPSLYNDTRFEIQIISQAPSQGGVTTGKTEIDIHSPKPQKFLYNGHLYILRDGKVFGINGHEIKAMND